MEIKKAGGNSDSPGVRAAIEKARTANVPSENIDRAIKKASEPGENLESLVYEAYGPGGCALIIETLSSNRNKVAQEIKHILSDHELALAGIGAAVWAFEKTGDGWVPNTTVELNETDGEKLTKLLDALEENDEVQEVFTNAA